MKKLQSNFEKLQTGMTVLCLVIMSLSSLLQVINRNILKLPISWTEELSRYSMIWMTMIGTGISVRKGMQMSLDIWGRKLRGIPRMVMDLFSCTMVLAFCVVVMVSVLKLVDVQRASNQLSPALHVPMYIMTLAIFLGMLFLCFVEIEAIVKVCRARGCDETAPEESEGTE